MRIGEDSFSLRVEADAGCACQTQHEPPFLLARAVRRVILARLMLYY